MRRLLGGVNQTFKPVPGMRLDPSHPLGAGMAECYALAEGAGLLSVDPVTGVVYTLGAPASWGAPSTVYGRPVKLAGTGTNNHVSSPARYTTLTGNPNTWTIEARFYPRAMANNVRYSLYSGNNEATGVRFPQLEVGKGSATVTTTTGRVAVHNSNGFIAELADGTLAANNHYHTVFTKFNAGASHAIDLNGVPRALVTNLADVLGDSCSQRVVGNRSVGAANQPFNGDVYWLRVWRRSMQPAERQQLFVDPWCMFVVPGTRAWFLPPPAGAPPVTSANPAAIMGHL